ncbi:MAG: hypothetical protein NVS3B20_23320 [Polyangiales bacterium]
MTTGSTTSLVLSPGIPLSMVDFALSLELHPTEHTPTNTVIAPIVLIRRVFIVDFPFSLVGLVAALATTMNPSRKPHYAKGVLR